MLLKDTNTENINERISGVLLHPTSLPSPYGIGDLGYLAYHFIDFLIESKQSLWQILPIGPTGFGDSPYQSFSSFAGQPLIISPDKLIEENLLDYEDINNSHSFHSHKIDYGLVINYKFSLLKKAYSNFNKSSNNILIKEYELFCNNNKQWLDDYALFMACKDYFGGKVWSEWDTTIANPTQESKDLWREKLYTEVNYYKFIQYIFYKQWTDLKNYANKNGIKIIGDIPIFVSYDSSDVWANRELFSLDSNGYPTDVAGVPPDYFSESGQLWGNPLYNWAIHKKTNYKWWISRLSHNLQLVDIIRIDHFRGFESYWSIPYGNKTAINGTWKKGPSNDLFDAICHSLGNDLPIIAEDLGIITDEVKKLRDDYNLPGMKILQFAFEDMKDNDFLPHNYTFNTICYSGTHDNDTTVGWYQKVDENKKDKVRRYMNTDANNISWDFIRTCFSSVSQMAIVPLQDILSLDTNARMNLPGTSMGNWQWRYTEDMLNNNIIHRLKQITILFGRNQSMLK
jgi:4-alpha-glucanotransferase